MRNKKDLKLKNERIIFLKSLSEGIYFQDYGYVSFGCYNDAYLQTHTINKKITITCSSEKKYKKIMKFIIKLEKL